MTTHTCVIETKNYWIDTATNNTLSKSRIKTKDEAIKAFGSMACCVGCVDCVDCSNCINCIDSDGCSNCVDCVSCSACVDCVECSDQVGLIEKRNVH